jgi:hypothetical protein
MTSGTLFEVKTRIKESKIQQPSRPAFTDLILYSYPEVLIQHLLVITSISKPFFNVIDLCSYNIILKFVVSAYRMFL